MIEIIAADQHDDHNQADQQALDRPGIDAPIDPSAHDAAQDAGAFAVRSAVAGQSGFMVGFHTTRQPEYATELCLVPLEQVANAEKKFPLEWINEAGNGILPAFADYCLPLLGKTNTAFSYLRV